MKNVVPSSSGLRVDSTNTTLRRARCACSGWAMLRMLKTATLAENAHTANIPKTITSFATYRCDISIVRSAGGSVPTKKVSRSRLVEAADCRNAEWPRALLFTTFLKNHTISLAVRISQTHAQCTTTAQSLITYLHTKADNSSCSSAPAAARGASWVSRCLSRSFQKRDRFGSALVFIRRRIFHGEMFFLILEPLDKLI